MTSEPLPLADPAASVRYATADDVDEVIRLRGVMFASMGCGPYDPTVAWAGLAAEVVRAGLARGDLFALVLDETGTAVPGGRLVASVVVEVQQRLPSPWGPAGTLAYLSSVATDPEHRRRGYARAVVAAAIAACEARGVERVELHATEMALPLYRELGFEDRAGGPELRLRRA